MATTRPSTPTNQSSAPPTPQTGTWIHPRFDEIARRQNARTFTDRNLKTIVANLGGLFGIWFADKFIRAYLPSFYLALESFQPWGWWFLWAVRSTLLFFIFVASLPLIRPKDDLSDIPLTPSQRALLGLAPLSAPPTSGSQYVTPPRYPRSSTPLSNTPNSSYSNSGVSGKGSPSQVTPSKASPFSLNASPLLHKAIGGMAGGRRSSYGSPSPLGPGGSSVVPSTPTPAGVGKGASVGLNSKWLYEKGRRSSGNARLFS